MQMRVAKVTGRPIESLIFNEKMKGSYKHNAINDDYNVMWNVGNSGLRAHLKQL